VETIKRQTRAVYGCLDIGQERRPIKCTPALSMTQQHCRSCSCHLWRYVSVMPVPLTQTVWVECNYAPLTQVKSVWRRYRQSIGLQILTNTNKEENMYTKIQSVYTAAVQMREFHLQTASVININCHFRTIHVTSLNTNVHIKPNITNNSQSANLINLKRRCAK